jgi:hypothetical protein
MTTNAATWAISTTTIPIGTSPVPLRPGTTETTTARMKVTAGAIAMPST